MDYCVFIVIAFIFFVISYKVGIKKHIYLINSIDKEDAKKISDRESVSKGFGLYYFFLGIVSCICGYMTHSFGMIGFGISVSILLVLFLISIIIAIQLYNSIS